MASKIYHNLIGENLGNGYVVLSTLTVGEEVVATGRLSHQALRRCGKFFRSMCCQVLHYELKATELAQSLDRRWQRCKYDCP